MGKFTVIVLDSVGVGELPDAADFGDVGTNTLRHVDEFRGGLNIPNMKSLGLFNIDGTGLTGVDEPEGCYGKAVEQAKNEGLDIPVIYNTSGYETVDTIKALEGVVDVYLPDFKYMNPQIAEKYSHAGDYPPVAKLAIEEMVRQKSRCLFYPERSTLKDSMKNGTVTSEAEEGYLIGQGIIVRQLLLPGLLSDAKEIVRYLHERYGDSIYLSLMSQYTPLKHVEKYPELNRKVTDEEYEAYIDYAIEIGVEKGFIQEGDVAEESFIPHFDCEGV